MREAIRGWRRGLDWVKRLLQTHWTTALKLRDHARMSEETFHLFLAGLVGIIGGLTQLGYLLFNLGFLTGLH